MEADRRLLGDRRTEIREQRAGPKFVLKGAWPILIAATVLVAVGAYSGLSSAGSVSSKSAPPAALGMSVSHTNSGLTLVWNPSAPILRGALEAELIIQDGDRMSRVFLSPGQIRSGNLGYAPVSGDVRFSLRAKSGDRSATETVFALEAPIAAYNSVAPASRTARHVPLAPPATMLPGAMTFPAAFSTDAIASQAAPEKFTSYGRRLADLAQRALQRQDGPH